MEYTLSYPFSKRVYYLRILSSCAALFLFAFFIVTSATLLLTPTFVTSSTLVALAIFVKNQRTIRGAWSQLKSNGKYLREEAEKHRPYRKITAIFLVFVVSFSMILVIPGEVWMGGVLGVIAGYGVADAIFFSRIRRLERSLGGEIVRLVVTEEAGDADLYVRLGFLLLEW